MGHAGKRRKPGRPRRRKRSRRAQGLLAATLSAAALGLDLGILGFLGLSDSLPLRLGGRRAAAQAAAAWQTAKTSIAADEVKFQLPQLQLLEISSFRPRLSKPKDTRFRFNFSPLIISC